MKQTKRTQRVAEVVRREVSSLLLTEGHLGQFERVVVTDCQVSTDLRIARLYYAILGDDDREEAQKRAQTELEAVRGHFRHQVGRVLRTKYTPDLAFHFDETLEGARRIEAVLERVGPLPPEPTEPT